MKHLFIVWLYLCPQALFQLELQVLVREKKGKLLYKREKKGDYASFCV